MTKIVVGDLHARLTEAGIPIDGVALDRPNAPGISIDFRDGATDEQKLAAQKIVDAYDQDVENGLKPTAKTSVLSDEEIDGAKTVSDMKLLLKKLNAKG